MMSLSRYCRTALLSAMCLLASPVATQTLQDSFGSLIQPITKGSGPSEHITGFRAASDAAQKRLDDDTVGQLGRALISQSGAAQREAELNLGIQILGDTQGSFGALGTLAEHALWVESFGDVNNAMNNIGLVLALAQVARDGWNGNDSAALTGGIKAWMNFVVGRFGTGAMQIGSVAVFVVDVTLREWQSGLSAIANDLWTCRYLAWYQEHPRKISEWTEEAWKLYLASEKDGQAAYATYIDAMLNSWVHRAFLDPEIATYGNCGGSSFGGRSYIEAAIEAENKAVLQKMLADKVMPIIGARAWDRTLKAQVRDAEASLMPKLNRTVTLEVTAYGYPGGTQVVMPLPAGGEWKGKLRDDGTFKAALTRFAILKARFPDKLRLEGPEGPEERGLILKGDKLVAMFGTPETPIVTRFTLSEHSGSCTIKRISKDGTVSQEQIDDPAHPDQAVDFAILRTGAWVFGQYAPDTGWKTTSPALGTGDAIDFGAPYFDRISGFSNCDMGFLTNSQIVEGTCRVTRYDEKQVSARTWIQRTCTAPASLELAGFFASVMTGEMTWYPLDGPEGAMLVQILNMGLQKGFSGGAPDLSGQNMFPGMPSVPPVSGESE
ncbi:hypothetical protein [Falsiphaeobacter marinintestinus]|uniref:hypothetical protein n=1 Tax=Falsiphaeobacter marinintestinus TaxID=1492905 RepID=UPI0011B401F8|nr:hypothetical protein [Phaeobacter marinintestinus]